MTPQARPTPSRRTARDLIKRAGEGLFDALEPRVMLADGTGAFAGVGLAYEYDDTDDTTYAVVVTMEGEIDSAGNWDTVIREPGPNGASEPESLPTRRVSFLGGGRYLVDQQIGAFGEAIFGTGSRFFAGDGYGAGWSILDYSDQDATASQELAFYVERPTDATIDDAQGSWRFSEIIVDDELSSMAAFNGTAVITGMTIAWSLELEGGAENWTSEILSVSADGTVLTSDGRTIFLGAGGSAFLLAEMANDDQLCSLGVGGRIALTAFAPASLVGGYRVGLGRLNTELGLPGAAVEFTDFYLDLRSDGTYEAFNLINYDLGILDPVLAGNWSLEGETITLGEELTSELTKLVVSADGSTLLVSGFGDVLDAALYTPALGVATRAIPATSETTTIVFSTTHLDDAGRPLVYQLHSDDSWRVVDLVEATGAPAVTGDFVSWIDPKDGLNYAAGITGSGLVLFAGDADGSWSFRNLTGEIEISAPITTSLEVMISADGGVNLVGLNGEQDLARYFQTGSSGAGGFAWGFVNIAASELRATGQAMPAFAGELVSYATPWGGLNVAGLDSAGDIWSVWWAPGQSHWFATNLSAEYNAEPIAGGLTVYLTPWDGINIAGIDSAGQLRVAWWVPTFGAQWQHTNLTAESGGPVFDPGSVTSYVSSWGGLNVAGLDQESGEVKVYWWSPERTELGWAATSLSESVGLLAAAPTGSLRGVAASDRSLNVIGVSEGNDLLRYFWEPNFGGTWVVENLTVIAA